MIEIERIQSYYKNDTLIISKHALERIRERHISVTEIGQCLESGMIIEQYPDDWPFPSCLIYGKTSNGRILHIVVSEEDEGGGRIITAYEPDIETFEADLQTRRSKK